MKKIGIIILVCVVLYFVLTVPIIKVIQFEQTRVKTGDTYYIKRTDETKFQIVFTHSIHLTDVIETYEIDEKRIRLLSMDYSDVAIGMPAYAEEGQTLIYEDGFYTLQYDEAILDDFTLYIGDVDYELTFKYEAQQYNLKEVLGRGNTYNISIQNISILEWMKGEEMK